jgi:hypothetical protein
MVLLVLLASAVSLDLAGASSAANPRLGVERRIRTRPFGNRNGVFAKDNEGSAYVPRDQSLWLADDNGRAVYEVNPATGGLKRGIGRKQFEAARRRGGGARAGINRTRDFESIAYDRAHDSLYVFSGWCCAPSVKPTVFRLKRNANGVFHVESYQPLSSRANYTAAAWNAANGMIYVGFGRDVRSYNYGTNSVGRGFRVPNLTDIMGMGFSAKGDLFVTTGTQQLRRVNWRTKRLRPGWTFDLTDFGIHDGRAVELIGGRVFVSDGDDARSKTDPFKYAVYVFSLN